MRNLAIEREHYFGYPLPCDTAKLMLSDRFPYPDLATMGGDGDVGQGDIYRHSKLMEQAFEQVARDGDCEVVNLWVDSRGREVYLYRSPGSDKTKHVVVPNVFALRRASMSIKTFCCQTQISAEAELKAMQKLSELIPKHLFDLYVVNGSFIETSARSGILYNFRKNKPTVAYISRGSEPVRPLVCLCWHGIGYYARTWAGAMAPTDDVISHLLMMRGDERRYWGTCNQHPIDSLEGGL